MIWALRSDPAISVKKRHAMQKLDLNFMPIVGDHPPMAVQNTMSVRIDYE